MSPRPTAREVLRALAPAHERLNHDIVAAAHSDASDVIWIQCSCGEPMSRTVVSDDVRERLRAGLCNVPTEARP